MHRKAKSSGLANNTLDLDVPPVATAERRWYLDLMTNSWPLVLLGVVLLYFSIIILWQTESKHAKLDCLLSLGRASCRGTKGPEALSENCGRLVHIKNQRMKAKALVRDPQFSEASVDSACLRLRSNVEVFQYIERAEYGDHGLRRFPWSDGHDHGQRRYTYSEQWSDTFHCSTAFHDKSKVNSHPPGFSLGQFTTNCESVEFGDSFDLPASLLEQCQNFQLADHLLPEKLCLSDHSHAFSLHSDHHFYFRAFEWSSQPPGSPRHITWRGGECNVAEVAETPQIGDARVKFTYVPEGDATIMALQTDQRDKLDGQRHSFLPYRLISQGLCGMTEEQEKTGLIREGQETLQRPVWKDDSAHSSSGRESVWRALFCCRPSFLFSGIYPTGIYMLQESPMEVDQCFKEIVGATAIKTWTPRLSGWFLMYSGLFSIFFPILPILVESPFLSHFYSGALWMFCGLTTFALATFIVGLAYFAYRPLSGILWMLTVAVIVWLPSIVSGSMGWHRRVW